MMAERLKRYIRYGWRLAILLPWLIYFQFHYRFSFNYETDVTGQYQMAWALPVLVAALLFYLWKPKAYCSAASIINAVLITALCCCLLFSTYYSFANEHFFVCCAIYFLMVSLFFSKIDIGAIHLLIILFVSFFAYQLYMGLEQYITEAAYTQNIALALKGSLQNSGIYGCYLAIHLPWLYYLLIEWKPERLRSGRRTPLFFGEGLGVRSVLFMLIASITVFLIIKTQSRTAYIALFACIAAKSYIVWGGWLKRKITSISTLAKAALIIFSISVTGVVVWYLFAMKKMSAMGRLMKLRITTDHISDDFWLGTGLGRFTWYYPQWQAQYFATHSNAPESYFLSAGESYIIFNEYVQLFKEIGFIGFVAFVGLLVYFFSARSGTHKRTLDALKLTMITILSCGFTSYPFHVNIFLLMMGFCFVSAAILRENATRLNARFATKWRKVIIAGLLALVAITGFKGFKQLNAVRHWQQLTNGADQDMAATYESLYNDLKNDGKFLTEYGIYLSTDSMSYHKAARLLEKAKQTQFTRKTIEAAIYLYTNNGQLNNAIEYAEWLSNYLPNRFTPKYELMTLYQKTGDTANTRRTANAILSMPVKIPSAEVDRIKKDAAKYLAIRP